MEKRNLNTIQEQFASTYDQSKLFSYDVEFIDAPTAPLLHQTSRLLYIRKGKGKITIDGVLYPFAQNSLISILPWQTSVIEVIDEPVTLTKIIFNSDYIFKFTRTYCNPAGEFFAIEDPIREMPVLRLDTLESGIVVNILRNIKNEIGIESLYELNEERFLSNTLTTNYMIELLVHVERFILSRKGIADNDLKPQNLSAKIYRYLFAHLGDKPTLEQLAVILNLKEAQISKVIQEETSLSYPELLNQMRVAKTVDLVTYTDLSLIDIAETVGFSNASYLIKVFESTYHMSPTEYRDIHQAKDELMKEKGKSTIYRIISYIDEHFSEDLRSIDVANKFGLSVVELNKSLLYILEKNFEEYLHFVRINKACKLLLNTDESIMDIGIDVGYNTQKTFVRNFARLKKMNPGDFRRNVSLQLDDEETGEE